MQQNRQTKPRRRLAHVSFLGTNQLHLRNPWVIAGWSVVFPGLGHLLLSKYIRGFILFIWEIFINSKANINISLIYAFTGRFELSKQALDVRWLALYFPTYLFAIWDSYRSAVDLNHEYILAAREDAEFKPFVINALGCNYLDKRSPLVSVAWSLLMPGTGQLYLHRLMTTVFILGWWIAAMYYSELLPAIQYTLLGDFSNATRVLNPHWLMNIPSIYFFAVYDAYANTVENNKLYDWEQRRLLNRDYLNPSFRMPLAENRTGDHDMYVISTFDHSKRIELAITAIQASGIPKENILAVSLDKKGDGRTLFDAVHYSDNLSLLDLPLILAAVFSILGAAYGFVLSWGPVIWGLIGIAFGLCAGLAIKIPLARKSLRDRQNNRKAGEVVVIVSCGEGKLDEVMNIFWNHHALGVRKLDLGRNDVNKRRKNEKRRD